MSCRSIVLVAIAVLAMLCGGACKRGRISAAIEPELKAPIVKDDSDGLLFTWIDDKGDFHVEMRLADVPMMGRDTVRVVDPGGDSSRGERIFVADLRDKRADATYAVRTMARADFEAIAVARREKTGPTLASAAVPSAPPSGVAAAEPEPGTAKPASRTTVIIYGAEWCAACHDAARYLRKRGIAYVEKDVEKDAAAAREMQQKLAKSGMRPGSIPVLDVRGKMMVGFNPAEVDAALGEPL
jgi:glutaredoxin